MLCWAGHYNATQLYCSTLISKLLLYRKGNEPSQEKQHVTVERNISPGITLWRVRHGGESESKPTAAVDFVTNEELHQTGESRARDELFKFENFLYPMSSSVHIIRTLQFLKSYRFVLPQEAQPCLHSKQCLITPMRGLEPSRAWCMLLTSYGACSTKTKALGISFTEPFVFVEHAP